jgi:hypothetical protein
MKALLILLVCLGLLALSGCSHSGDGTAENMPSAALDQKLDQFEKMPVQNRQKARFLLENVIKTKGTAAQQKRFQDLLNGAH